MSFFKKIGKVFKKVGKGVKKVLPYAAAALPFIPGVGSAASSLVGGISNMWGGESSAQGAAQTFPVRNEGDAPPQQKSWLDTGADFLKSATPALVGGMNYYGQMQTNAANAKQAQAQMDFQNEQTSTAYQRGTADMKAAGLNPMLAYSQGGAQSGGGAQATMGNELGQGANSALSAAMTQQQLKTMELQNVQQQADTKRTNAETDYTNARRLDVLEGIGTHPVNRANTEARTQREKTAWQFDTESFEDRLKQLNSAWKATQADTANKEADNPWLRARAKVTSGFGDWVGDGIETINSGKKAAQQYPGWLGDFEDYMQEKANNANKAWKSYGKPKRPGYQ